jgi:hypothetical protein
VSSPTDRDADDWCARVSTGDMGVRRQVKSAKLFEGPWLPTPLTVANYDVSRDGKRFLMLKAAASDNTARYIVVVQNWFEVLKKRNK